MALCEKIFVEEIVEENEFITKLLEVGTWFIRDLIIRNRYSNLIFVTV